ncbi:TPA: M42 family metallopeptidase [Candidatus Bathyarchaeota archaeon]|nr:M42 family metallopeptidase [Candidatus Bathyarchaeota archaeon]
MVEESVLDIFTRFVEVQAPSGFEEPMMRAFMEEIKPYVDEVHGTPRGNMIAVQKGGNPKAPKVALVAHLDQIGFIVFNIDATGFVRFRKIGGSVTRAIQGQHLQILTEKGPIVGVVGMKPGHITTPAEANTIPPIEDMYIDIGARSREEAIAMGVRNGTPITYATAPVKLANGLIASPSIDDRAGCTALIQIAKRFAKKRPKATVYYIGSVEEEIGLRGAETCLHDLDVDMAVAVDTFPAGFQPDVNMRDLFYEVGKGAGLHVGELGDRVRIQSQQVHKWLRRTAEAHGIPHQVGIMSGGTDAMTMMQTRGGIPACTIGIPRRYSHSPVEVFAPSDLENLIKILTTAISELEPGFTTTRPQS